MFYCSPDVIVMFTIIVEMLRELLAQRLNTVLTHTNDSELKITYFVMVQKVTNGGVMLTTIMSAGDIKTQTHSLMLITIVRS